MPEHQTMREFAAKLRPEGRSRDHTWGTEWFREDEAASVVTERAAIAKGAAARARTGRTLGAARVTLRALESIARSGDASGRFGRLQDVWQER